MHVGHPPSAHPIVCSSRCILSCRVLVQARLLEAQQQLTSANAALQQLQQQINTITHQEKQAIGAKSRAAHKVQQLQVRQPLWSSGEPALPAGSQPASCGDDQAHPSTCQYLVL